MFVIAKQDRYVRALIRVDATSPVRATSIEVVGGRMTRVFRGLVRRGVIVESPSGRFYLDVSRSQPFLATRRRMALTALAVAAVLVLLAVTLSSWR